MKKIIALIVSAACSLSVLCALTNGELTAHLSGQDAATLAGKGYVIRENGGNKPLLMPQTAEVSRIDTSKNRMKSTIKYEAFYVVDRPLTDEEFLQFYTKLMDISIYPECNYYNYRHDQWWPVFDESYYIASASSANPVTYPEPKAIPAKETRFAFQTLPPYGSLINQYDFSSGNGVLHLAVKNVSPLKYEGFNILSKNSFLIDFLAVRTDDGMILYTLISADVFDMMGILKSKVTGPIGDRLLGFSEWYMKDIISPIFIPAVSEE